MSTTLQNYESILNNIYLFFQYVPYKNDGYKKPFFFAYTKASMFTVYFLIYIIFKELRKPCGNQTNYMVILDVNNLFIVFQIIVIKLYYFSIIY